MKKILTIIFLALITFSCLIILPACGACNHNYGEWITEMEPTFYEEGYRYRTCTKCGEVEEESIAKLEVAYTITLTSPCQTVEISVADDGVFNLPETLDFPGYEFLGYFDEEGQPFPTIGTTDKDLVVYVKYSILPTTTFAELKERLELGLDVLLASDITLTDTIYVSGEKTIYTSGNYTLLRASNFYGDLFVVGSYSNGDNPILDGKNTTLTIKPEENASITIDGKKSAITNTVNGTAFLLKNSATVNFYEGTKIVNCKKTGNAYFLENTHGISSPELIGGSAVIIANGTFNMYGGEIRNCEVDLDDSASTPSTDQVSGYNVSSRGGAIYNYGTFNMYDGIIDGCKAGRGGAIYNHRIMYLYEGTLSNNHSSSYGGLFYNPNSQYVYCVLGREGQDVKLFIQGNTAGKTGGAGFSSHQSTIYVQGGTIFKQNQALSGNGGAINAAGEVVIDYARFDGNVASSKGGAIYAYYNSPGNSIRIVHVKTGVFENNQAPRGGAIAFGCGDEVDVGAIGKIGTVLFINNVAPKNSTSYGFGAAIHLDDASQVEIYGDTTFEQNSSEGNGGAIYATKQSTLNVLSSQTTSIEFIGNSSGKNGGAIYNSNSTITISAIEGNVYFDENVAADNGGGLAVHSGGTIILYGVTATQNSAESNGGFLYVYGGNAVIGDDLHSKPSIFTSNHAGGGGGAIYVSEDGTLNANAITLRANSSDGNGGAIYIYTDSSATINNLVAENNSASGKFGGVMYISGKATCTIKSITATGNSAKQGGCIYITTTNTMLTIEGGNVNGNTATETGGGNAIYGKSSGSILKLKTDAEDNILLQYTEGEITGSTAITPYKEVA